MTDKKDNIFAKPVSPLPFRFDESVAEVFPDMISRSVPGYQSIIRNFPKLASRFVTDNTNCYDLGCSLGAVSLAMSSGINANDVQIIGIDNSAAMIERCQHHIDAFKHATPIKLIEADISKADIQNASLVALNFTLQFIAKEERAGLLQMIFNGMNKGAALVLSEKIKIEEPSLDQLMIDLHHEFKMENGYSALEISQKRNALENVLVPETIQTHHRRLKDVGFTAITNWLQHYNFVSIIAVK